MKCDKCGCEWSSFYKTVKYTDTGEETTLCRNCIKAEAMARKKKGKDMTLRLVKKHSHWADRWTIDNCGYNEGEGSGHCCFKRKG